VRDHRALQRGIEDLENFVVAGARYVRLIPDMPVEAFVQTGDRTMMSYLVKPLQDQLMRAFREK